MTTVKRLALALCLVLTSLVFTGFSVGVAGAADEACLALVVGDFEATGVEFCP